MKIEACHEGKRGKQWLAESADHRSKVEIILKRDMAGPDRNSYACHHPDSVSPCQTQLQHGPEAGMDDHGIPETHGIKKASGSQGLAFREFGVFRGSVSSHQTLIQRGSEAGMDDHGIRGTHGIMKQIGSQGLPFRGFRVFRGSGL
jgi:hypothetical protein